MLFVANLDEQPQPMEYNTKLHGLGSCSSSSVATPVIRGALIAAVIIWPVAFLPLLATTVLHQHMMSDCPSKAAAPSRDEFFEQHFLPVEVGKEELFCIICRDVPHYPKAVLRCSHLFCHDCFHAWVNRHHNTCPYCMTVLFQPFGTRTEQLAKLLMAASIVALPLTLVYTLQILSNCDAASWRHARLLPAIMQTWCTTNVLFFRSAWREYGSEWWKNLGFLEYVRVEDEERFLKACTAILLVWELYLGWRWELAMWGH